MNTKFTPGPWTFEIESSSFIDNGHIIEGGGMQLAHVENWLENEEESAANAKLIAAAPLLLEALILAKSLCQVHGLTSTEAYSKIESAIKKATE